MQNHYVPCFVQNLKARADIVALCHGFTCLAYTATGYTEFMKFHSELTICIACYAEY